MMGGAGLLACLWLFGIGNSAKQRIRLLRLSFNQYRLYPHICPFNLPFGCSLTIGRLMALPTCYVPLWGFPLRLAVVNGHLNTCPVACQSDIRQIPFTGARVTPTGNLHQTGTFRNLHENQFCGFPLCVCVATNVY